jgi:hypothetical protein
VFPAGPPVTPSPDNRTWKELLNKEDRRADDSGA